jgi:hypothetical protein
MIAIGSIDREGSTAAGLAPPLASGGKGSQKNLKRLLMDFGVLTRVERFAGELNRQDAKVTEREEEEEERRIEAKFPDYLTPPLLCVLLASLASWRFNSPCFAFKVFTTLESIMSHLKILGTLRSSQNGEWDAGGAHRLRGGFFVLSFSKDSVVHRPIQNPRVDPR